MKCHRKCEVTQSFAKNRVFKLRWKDIAFVLGRDLEKAVCRNPCSMVCEDEPRCALVDDKHFKAINIDNKRKVRTKCQLSAQKCSVITGTFQ